MSSLSGLDPITLANSLVSAERAGMDSLLGSQQRKFSSQLTAVNSLSKQLSAFQSLLGELTAGSGLLSNSANLSTAGIAKITAASTAASGQYSLFVEQLAQAHQLALAFDGESWQPPGDGLLSLSLGDQAMSLDLASLAPGSSLTDLRDAINQATDNPGIQASLVRSNGQMQLLLTSQQTGAANRIDLALNGGTPGVAQDQLQAAIAGQRELSAARDALVRLGESNPLSLTSASNRLEGLVDGLTLELTRAQAAGEPPLRVSVGQDSEAIQARVQKFIDDYNELVGQVGNLTSSDKGGALKSDAATRSLMSQLRQPLSQPSGGLTLGQLGIKTDRYGKLSLDNAKLSSTLASQPALLAQGLVGEGGVLARMQQVLEPYLERNGLLGQRSQSLQASLDRVAARQEALDLQMASTYQRYLAQFTQMQSLVSQMEQTSNLFTNYSSGNE